MAKDKAIEEVKGEEAVFGSDSAKKVSPITTEKEGVKGRTIEVDEDAMKNLLQRLADLEADQTRRTQAEEDIFNPLKEIKDKHTIRISFYNDKLVVGYVGKERPDGTIVYVSNQVIEEGEFKGQMRGMVTLQYEDGTTEVVDHVRFLTEVSTVSVPIKDRKDIGKTVEQGEVSKTMWNGRSLVPTSSRIMTGYKEQRFVFTVDYKGKEYTISQDVINLK